MAFAQGKNLKQLDVVGINGTWQNNKESHLPRSIWGICANKYGAIGLTHIKIVLMGIKRNYCIL